jgi:hypothetical protein
MTEDGYRRNQEVFAALDYCAESESPRPVLDEILAFLREAVAFAQPAGGSGASPAVQRWLAFLDRVKKDSRGWGAADQPRSWSKPRVFAVLSGSDRRSIFESLGERWAGNPPNFASVVSPFFDDPSNGPNRPAKQIWNLLKQRGAASVEYHVTTEEVPGEPALLLHAPESLRTAQPANRSQVDTAFRQLALEDGRPLHAKCLWLENERWILSMIGSSNFTSAGLGLGRARNLEANIAFVVGRQGRDASKALENAWPAVNEIPDGVELRWNPLADEGEDSADDVLLLPEAFCDATFGSDGTGGNYLEFTLAGSPPKGWSLFVEEESEPFATEADWVGRGSPAFWQTVWTRSRPPCGFRVNWQDSVGFAWWPVNVLNGATLPPPDDLKDLPLEVLIEILTSAKPLHVALARHLKRKRKTRPADERALLDPHKRVDTSAFLLQRTRRLSWALSALRHRLERPVPSEQSLAWRLRGPVGALALVRAIERDLSGENRPDLERCFLLTEVCLELARVHPKEDPGSLRKVRVRAALRELIEEIREGISSDALADDPVLAAYSRRVFEEVVK